MRLVPAMLAAAFTCITACEKGPSAEAEPAPAPVVVTSADIIGRWIIHPSDLHDAAFNMIKNQVEARDLPVDDEEINRHVDKVADFFRQNMPVYTFNADNTFTLDAGEVSSNGRWSIAGDTLTMSPADDDREIRFRYEPGNLGLIPRTDWGRSIRLIPKVN
jgi:hypothetical protein